MGQRTITVVSLSTISEGESNGKPWKLSKVEALDQSGNPIGLTLKTFANLPTGSPITVDIEVQHHDQYGDQYMVKLPKGAAAGGGQQLTALNDRIQRLESRVADLERQLSSSQLADPRAIDTRGPGGAHAPVPAGIADPDEIPF